MSGRILRVAREEWRALIRNRVALVASLLLAALVVTAALVSIEQRNAIDAARARYQATVDQQFDAQPDRHPHRMVHYGQFVFRPLSSLAFFDSGVDSFTGNIIFLEGHRQNSANFSEARQSSLLLRFGQLTPAFVLQTLAPLLVIFLAFGSIARERERGTLRVLLAQGMDGRRLILGKMLGHSGILTLIAGPAFLVLIGLALFGGAPAGPTLLMILGYSLYLLLWVAAAVLISALLPRQRDALIALVAIWMVSVILLPRTLPSIAAANVDLPTRIETDIAIHRDLKQIGDSHNPDDPYFNTFKEKVLKRYGVEDVEDLPVQYAGLVGMEGERLTSALFDRYARKAFAREEAQSRFVRQFGWASPVIALRQLSKTLAGTDLASHQNFLNQAERYRYRFVQALNRMQVEQIPNRNPGEDPRIAASNWARLPSFAYRPPDVLAIGRDRVLPSLLILGGWVGLLALLVIPIGRRLGRATQ